MLEGSIAPNDGEKISDETWQRIISEVPGFSEGKKAAPRNPMTGDRVPITNPPNKIADFTADGEMKGFIWLGEIPFDVAFEGNGAEFQAAIQAIAKIVEGEAQNY